MAGRARRAFASCRRALRASGANRQGAKAGAAAPLSVRSVAGSEAAGWSRQRNDLGRRDRALLGVVAPYARSGLMPSFARVSAERRVSARSFSRGGRETG